MIHCDFFFIYLLVRRRNDDEGEELKWDEKYLASYLVERERARDDVPPLSQFKIYDVETSIPLLTIARSGKVAYQPPEPVFFLCVCSVVRKFIVWLK